MNVPVSTLALRTPAEAGGAAAKSAGASLQVRTFHALAAAAAGIATLIKGPVGFLLPALVVLAVHLPSGRRGFLKRWLAPVNLALFLAITLPWFILLCRARPDFLRYGLVEESVRRYLTPEFHRTAPFYYYLPVIAGVFFPWSLLLPESAALAWRCRKRLDPADRMFLIWAVVVIVFFSLSRSKLPGYILTGVIALGILTGRLFARALQDQSGAAGRIIRHGTWALLGASAVLSALLLLEVHHAGRLEALFHFHSAELERMRPTMGPVAISLCAVGFACWLAVGARRIEAALTGFVLLPFLIVTVCLDGLCDGVRTSKTVAEWILGGGGGVPGGSATVEAIECFPPGLPFYLRTPVALISKDGHELTSNYLLYSDGRSRSTAGFIPMARRDRWLDSIHGRLFLIGQARSLGLLDSIGTARGCQPVKLPPHYWCLAVPAAPAGSEQAQAPEKR